LLRTSGLEDLRNGRVFHQCQGLPLGVEARKHCLGIHASPDKFDRDFAVDWRYLLRKPDFRHPSLTDLLQQSVWTKFAGKRRQDRVEHKGTQALRPFECIKHLPEKLIISEACLAHILPPLVWGTAVH
jgi:hypothetical protein